MPAWCSAKTRRISATLKSPLFAREPSDNRSAAQSDRGPRIQSPIGIANPAFGRSTRFLGTYLWRMRRRIILPFAALDQRGTRKTPRIFHHAMIKQWHTRFQRNCHAGAIDLGEDVVGQIMHHVEIACPRARVGDIVCDGRVVPHRGRFVCLRSAREGSAHCAIIRR